MQDMHERVGIERVGIEAPDGWGPARVVVCPDCGQMEIWSGRECTDHGRCRSQGCSQLCEVCGEVVRSGHAHTCLACGRVIEWITISDCEEDEDHDYRLCDDCAAVSSAV